MLYEATYRVRDGQAARKVRFRCVSSRPSGLSASVQADIVGETLPFNTSRMADLIDLSSGEVIDDPTEHFVDRFLESEVQADGAVRLSAWIEALPTEGIGPMRARATALFAERWEALKGWMDGGLRGERSALTSLAALGDQPGVGFVVIDALEYLWRDAEQWARVEARERRWRVGPVARFEGPLSGERVCFSGTLATMSRRDAQRLAREAGAEIASGVAVGVTMLVAAPGAGSKVDKAKSYGIRIVTEDDFWRRLGITAP